MKVLQVSYADAGGGAAIGARRIHEALLSEGVESELLCVRTTSSAEQVYPAFGPIKTKLNSILNRILWHALYWFHKTDNKNLHSLNFVPTGLHRVINKSDADIVNLHWVNNEMISIREISKIQKPVVWTLHDMWPICGASHNVLGEYYVRFESGYKNQRLSEDNWPDLDLWTWRRKKRCWKNFNPWFVGVSEWMVGNVEKSKLFPDPRSMVIPNTIDIDVFKPMDKNAARKVFKLPQDKTIFVFACTTAPYKGMELLADSLRKYSDTAGNDSYLAVAFGRNEGIVGLFDDLPVRFIGRIGSEHDLAVLYTAADVTCVPSQVESFGQTAAEAMACAVPVVAFNCTGLSDIIDHKENGYLARPFDIDDFSNGLIWILNDCEAGEESTARSDTMCKSARDKAVSSFSGEVVAQKYAELYKGVIRSQVV